MSGHRCPVISRSALGKMKQAIEIGGVEFGGYLDKAEGGQLILDHLCAGDACSVHIQAPSSIDGVLMERGAWGRFHTHPGFGNSEPSPPDWYNAAMNLNFALCIGYKDADSGAPKVRCRLPRDWEQFGYGPEMKAPRLVKDTYWPSYAERMECGVEGEQCNTVEREMETPFGECHTQAQIWRWTQGSPELYKPGDPDIRRSEESFALDRKCRAGYPVVCDYEL